MSVIATALKHLIAAGVSGDDLVRAVADMEAELAANPPVKARSAGAIRTERYRARKAAEEASQSVTCDGSDACDVTSPALSPFPNENNSNPNPHTHPDMNTRAQGPWDFHVSAWATWRKANPFPRPWWAKPGLWADLKANRKAKRLPNTATAHAKFLRDIGALVDDEWPPGRLLEAIVARGWAAAYDPRTKTNDRVPRQSACNDEIQNPYVRAVVARQAARSGDGGGQPDCWP